MDLETSHSESKREGAETGPEPTSVHPYGQAHRSRFPWPDSAKVGVSLLVIVLAIATVMLPFLLWFIAPLLFIAVVVAAGNARRTH